jgi:ssDNA-binding Zn-finger/Zn-ribbon topoisomerase 1
MSKQSKRLVMPTSPMRVERVCPRCHSHRYHMASMTDNGPRVKCSECSHSWKFRLLSKDI